MEKLVINDISPTAQIYHRLNSKALQLIADESWKNEAVVFTKLLGTCKNKKCFIGTILRSGIKDIRCSSECLRQQDNVDETET